jgi:hypothetical protein
MNRNEINLSGLRQLCAVTRRCVPLLFVLTLLCGATPVRAQNKVMGSVEFVPASKVEKASGVWIDGEYVGYVHELRGDKTVYLLPGDHEISVRQSGYKNFTTTVTIEPGKPTTVNVKMEKDPDYLYSNVNAEVKLKVTPDRAAVFVDEHFVGYVHEFGGVGRSMLVPPGKHQIKIALPGYKDFVSDINLRPNEKYTLKTDLLPASITEADPSIKKD